MSTKELKKELRAFRKLKKETQKGTPIRRDMNKKIREIKKQLVETEVSLQPDAEKQKLIDEILVIYRQQHRPEIVDLRVHSIQELQIHLNKLKGIK